METNDAFAQRLRNLRETKGLSVRGLAAHAGVSSVTIWKWESGLAKPRDRKIISLAKALAVSPAFLSPAIPTSQEPGRETKLLSGHSSPSAGNGEEANGSSRSSVAPPEGLAEAVARAKEMIAKASGVKANQVSVRIEY